MGTRAGAAAKNDDDDERRGGLVVGSLDLLVVGIIVIIGGSAATETLPQPGYLLWQLFFFVGRWVGPKTRSVKIPSPSKSGARQ
jgi:hypothetical protein